MNASERNPDERFKPTVTRRPVTHRWNTGRLKLPACTRLGASLPRGRHPDRVLADPSVYRHGARWTRGPRGRRRLGPSSGARDELSILRDVLDRESVVSEVTSDADVETAKPNPDIVEIALARAGVEADRAVFVGDTV